MQELYQKKSKGIGNKKYEISLRDSRTGLDYSLEEMALIDKTLTEGTKNGQVFDNLNQDDLNKLTSHINSYYRDTIETTPINLAKKYFGNQLLQKLKITEIPSEEANLKPDLLK